jgi:DNA gyrase subunit A
MKKNQKPNKEIGYVRSGEVVEEMRKSYIDYAMSVIVSRALPDVRDGLKPVHRRILYAMLEDGLTYSAKFRKSATVVGSTLGRYHPHGDVAVYDSLARMAQTFSLRYPLIKGQGNFGCFTKDTKVRLTDGRSISFGKLIQEQAKGKKHWTFSFNHEEKKIEITEIKKPRLTRKNSSLVEVKLDNGGKIRCTLDHKFMLRNGKYREAKRLKEGDSLMPLYTNVDDGEKDKNLKGYTKVFQPIEGSWSFTHHLSDNWNLHQGVYEKKEGRVRHHIDFNKLNNNPDNVQRMQWGEHWRLHAKLASWRHKNDPEYVEKIKKGREEFIKNNPQFISERASNRNRIMWQNSKYRKTQIERLKMMWKDEAYKEFMQKQSSKNLKRLWQDREFQELMSDCKSREMKARWKDPEYRKKRIAHMQKISQKIWSDPAHREFISNRMKEITSDPKWKKKQSGITKALWKNPEYRAKFPKDHFIQMGKKLWEDENTRIFHSEKARKQWQDPVFRKKALKTIKKTAEKRVKENPQLMKELADKAAISLEKKWKDKEYKERVIKSKVLRHVKNLIENYKKITPELYEKERVNNGIPKIENAIKYFKNFEEMTEKAETYNHKVVSVKFLKKKENVYDITVDPWHNFALGAGIFVHNSIDGDPPAAQRYTECKMSKEGEEMLKDINKNTVNFIDNYDGSRREPAVLPSPLPQLLLNGSLGIAVGMATSIPPHNLTEVVDASVYLLENPKADTEDLFKFVKGPDFPTGGAIFNRKEILEAYSQGKGPIVSRGKAEIKEPKEGRTQIIITEIPYQVQKSKLIKQLASLVQNKRVNGVKDIRDESDKEGLRIAIDLQKGAFAQKILNHFYKFTDLQKTYHLNMLALVGGIQPKTLSLAEVLEHFLEHRKVVITRRTEYDLKKAKERAHILEGLYKCLSRIDEVIKVIKKSENRESALKNLMVKFKLTQIQANAILDTKLSALAKLERKRIEDELKELKEKIKEYLSILKSPKKIKELVKKELISSKEEFGDERRTKVYTQKVGSFAEEDLIPQEETVITLTRGGYIKRVNPSLYRKQRRGGKGFMGLRTVGDDIVEHFLSAQTHDNLLFFTDSGKVFQMPSYEIPEGSRVAKGRGLLNFLEISSDDRILTLFSLGNGKQKEELKYLVMATKNGIIKKTPLEDFKNVRKSGLIAISLRKNDALRQVSKTSGNDEIILVTKKGQSIRFKEKEIRSMGRTASGIKGIRIKKDDEVVGMDIIRANKEKKKSSKDYLMIVTENGYGKRTELKEFKAQKRGGSGIKAAKVNKKTGDIANFKVLEDEEDLIVISRKGHVIRTKIGSISKLGRATQGVRIMRMAEGDKIASAAFI